jgi:hypothetical protein
VNTAGPTTVISLKGKLHEYGPELERAPRVVYIGRACYQGSWRLARSDWGNPFTVQQMGGVEKAVEAYRRWLLAPGQAELRARIVPELRGRTLGCWCKPGLCHGHVLAAAADGGLRALTDVDRADPGGDCGDGYASAPVRLRHVAPVTPRPDWAARL